MMMTLMMMIFSTRIRKNVELSILRQHDIKRNSNYLQIMILAVNEIEKERERGIYKERERERKRDTEREREIVRMKLFN